MSAPLNRRPGAWESLPAAAKSFPMALACALTLALAWTPALFGQSQSQVLDLFLRLPDSEANGLTEDQRRALWESLSAARGYSPPSAEGFWLEARGGNAISLFGIHHMPAVYKFFPGTGAAGILAICRSLQTSGPAAADERSESAPAFDLTFYQAGAGLDLVRVDHEDVIPPVGVLDFTTMDTMEDYYARKDLELINQHFRRCLTCHASTEDPAALDIVTITSISGSSCASFITHYKLLPLAWNGKNFEKPYDRAVNPDEPWPKRGEQPHGIYYHSPPPGP